MSTPNERRKPARKVTVGKKGVSAKLTAHAGGRPPQPYLAPFGIPMFGYGVPGREA